MVGRGGAWLVVVVVVVVVVVLCVSAGALPAASSGIINIIVVRQRTGPKDRISTMPSLLDSRTSEPSPHPNPRFRV